MKTLEKTGRSGKEEINYQLEATPSKRTLGDLCEEVVETFENDHLKPIGKSFFLDVITCMARHSSEMEELLIRREGKILKFQEVSTYFHKVLSKSGWVFTNDNISPRRLSIWPHSSKKDLGDFVGSAISAFCRGYFEGEDQNSELHQMVGAPILRKRGTAESGYSLKKQKTDATNNEHAKFIGSTHHNSSQLTDETRTSNKSKPMVLGENPYNKKKLNIRNASSKSFQIGLAGHTRKKRPNYSSKGLINHKTFSQGGISKLKASKEENAVSNHSKDVNFEKYESDKLAENAFRNPSEADLKADAKATSKIADTTVSDMCEKEDLLIQRSHTNVDTGNEKSEGTGEQTKEFNLVGGQQISAGMIHEIKNPSTPLIPAAQNMELEKAANTNNEGLDFLDFQEGTEVLISTNLLQELSGKPVLPPKPIATPAVEYFTDKRQLIHPGATARLSASSVEVEQERKVEQETKSTDKPNDTMKHQLKLDQENGSKITLGHPVTEPPKQLADFFKNALKFHGIDFVSECVKNSVKS